jgi:hypothetical protein
VTKRSVVVVAVIALMLCAAAAQCLLSPTKVSGDEEQNWVRYTVPLPKSISIPEKVVVSKSQVVVSAEALDDIVVKQAAEELAGLFGTKPERTVQTALGAHFVISLRLGGPEATGLEKLKNSEQAYYIKSFAPDRIQLIALKPAGLYYASKTLQQLVAAKIQGDQVEMPLVAVTDWPDIQDRGLWGSDCHEELPWLADRKLNWMEQISNQYVDMKTGKPVATIKEGREPLLTVGPQRAIKFLPVVLHLEQSSGKGPIAYYPYIKGKSEHHGAMCYSQPKTIEIIASWIEQLASLPHVEEVDVWQSENLGGKIGCQCGKCKATGVNPMVLEARAIVKAWRMAQQKLGRNFGIRILTSEATYDYEEQILSELPKEVKVIFYHSLLSYTCDKRPMMPDFLVKAAKEGRWVATCPNISAIVGYEQPFESAQFARYRALELVRNNAQGILAYATPRVRMCRYNVEAMAEYTWNLKGRSTHEFAYSWAVRNGVKDPEKFAEFRETVGPVEWSYNGGDWPMRAWFDHRLKPSLEGMLIEGRLPKFGYYTDTFVKCPFGAYSSPELLKKDLAASERAIKLAEEMGVDEYIQESRVAHGYISALDALYELSTLIKDQKVPAENKDKATHYAQVYVDGFREAIPADIKWASIKMPGVFDEKSVPKPTKESQQLINRMIATAKKLGIEVK